MFEVGDKVFYPNHGIGIIESIKEFEIADQAIKFFTVQIVSSNSTVKVPASNAVAVGLRELVGKDEIEAVFSYLRGSKLVKYSDWKTRFKENSDLMRTGKIEDMMVVLKSLHAVSKEKPLSFREKRMYDRALELIASEIAEIRLRTTRMVEEKLLQALGSTKAPRGS